MSFKKTLLTAGLLAASVSANALVLGQINFSAADSAFANVDFSTGIVDFTPDLNNANVTVSSGIFSGLNGAANATLSDFDYKGAGMDIIGKTIWATGGYTFTVTSLFGTPDEETNAFGSSLDLFGFGTISDGLEDLDGKVSISLDSTGGSFSFSATSVAVSEPATIALLGLGLAGLGFARRKQAQA